MLDHVRGVFFVQAEDGIRDLVRSRGLGDVYKRQKSDLGFQVLDAGVGAFHAGVVAEGENDAGNDQQPVSYTHLTLPTSDLV